MQGWVKTLDGADVYDEGTGWIWSARQQAWNYEPGLLTMPAAPVSVRVQSEVERLSSGWPTLKQAWRWQGPHAGGWFSKVVRVFVLLVGLYNLCMTPIWFTGLTHMHQWSDGVGHMALRGLVLGVLALLALFGLWHAHVYAVDPHKGWLVTGAVVAGTAWLAERREEREQASGGGQP